MVNNARGEVAVNIGGEDFIFIVTLKAMADIEDATGLSFPVLAQSMSKGVSVKTLLSRAVSFARAGAAKDVSAIEGSNDIAAVADAVAAAVSAAFKTDEPAKN